MPQLISAQKLNRTWPQNSQPSTFPKLGQQQLYDLRQHRGCQAMFRHYMPCSRVHSFRLCIHGSHVVGKQSTWCRIPIHLSAPKHDRELTVHPDANPHMCIYGA